VGWIGAWNADQRHLAGQIETERRRGRARGGGSGERKEGLFCLCSDWNLGDLCILAPALTWTRSSGLLRWRPNDLDLRAFPVFTLPAGAVALLPFSDGDIRRSIPTLGSSGGTDGRLRGCLSVGIGLSFQK